MPSLPVFTRYLYIKDDVLLALRGSLLNKDKESSYFWTAELLFSGFTDTTIDLLWQIYFDHYASSNITLEAYFKKKEKSAISEEQKQDFVCLMVSNLLVRNSTTDVYMLNKVTFEIYSDEEPETSIRHSDPGPRFIRSSALCSLILGLLSEEKIETLCYRWCSSSDEDRKEIVAYINTFFDSKEIKTKIEKKNTNKHVNSKTIFITRLIQGFTNIKNSEVSQPKKKQLYVVPDSSILEQHKTKERNLDDPRMSYQIYKDVAKLSPNQYNMIAMNRQNISDVHMEIWRNGYKWTPIAAKTTPIWWDRLEKFGKLTDDETPSVIWNSDDAEEDFYEKYWYDTEEQPMETQKKVIPRDMEKSSLWKTFQEKHNKIGIYHPCEEIIACFDE